jgi:hypothetical protein
VCVCVCVCVCACPLIISSTGFGAIHEIFLVWKVNAYMYHELHWWRICAKPNLNKLLRHVTGGFIITSCAPTRYCANIIRVRINYCFSGANGNGEWYHAIPTAHSYQNIVTRKGSGSHQAKRIKENPHVPKSASALHSYKASRQ